MITWWNLFMHHKHYIDVSNDG